MEKEILLVSENIDSSTNLIIGWLKLNDDVIIHRVSSGDKEYETICAKIESAHSIYLRRGNFSILQMDSKFPKLKIELSKLSKYYHFKAERSRNCLGSIQKEFEHNKLVHLDMAKESNLVTPLTRIVYSSNDLRRISKEFPDKSFITKAIGDVVQLNYDKKDIYGGSTNFVDFSKSESYNFNFASLIQEYIEKKFEVRAFYLRGEFYSMAIFSQNDSKTQLDFRNYNNERPNRMVPFALPSKTKGKLRDFMKTASLDTGSIDLIFSKSNEFIFLEVNPLGQFRWLSHKCNYHLEKLIAKELLK